MREKVITVTVELKSRNNYDYENRIKELKEYVYFKESMAEARKRLDSHDEQNKVLIALTEQVRGLSEDIKRIEKKLDGR